MLGLQFGEILKMSAKEGISMPTLREARDDVLYKTALQGMAFRQGMEPKGGANTYRVGVDFMTNQPRYKYRAGTDPRKFIQPEAWQVPDFDESFWPRT